MWLGALLLLAVAVDLDRDLENRGSDRGVERAAVARAAASAERDPREVAALRPALEPTPGTDPAPSAAAAPATMAFEPAPAAPSPVPQRVAADAERDRARHEAILADMRERDLKAARGSVAVTLYKTSWCGPCKKASAYLREHEIAHSERDVETDAGARDEARRLNPRGTVPTIDIDGEALIGWSPQRFETMLDSAARARAQKL
jgi:mycoredoxin